MNHWKAQSSANTLIVRLAGGLGNQLFQYAFGRRLAMRNQARLQLDASGYGTVSNSDVGRGERVFELSHFNIAAEVIGTQHDGKQSSLSVMRPLRKILRMVSQIADRRKPYFLRREIVEPARNYFEFDDRVYNLTFQGSVSVRGYWQSERYFGDIEDVIRTEIKVCGEMDSVNAEMARTIRGANSVAVHVRHGDNANEVAPQLGVLPATYYVEAVRAVRGEVGEPHLFVFSDDMAWARSILPPDCPSTFVEHNGLSKSHEDLRLMSLCRHHIVANSTFGWWGAWLGRKAGQLVIAPRRYYQNIDRPNPDLYPPGWRLI